MAALDRNGSWWYAFLACSRWVGFRLDTLAAITLSFECILIMAIHDRVSFLCSSQSDCTSHVVWLCALPPPPTLPPQPDPHHRNCTAPDSAVPYCGLTIPAFPVDPSPHPVNPPPTLSTLPLWPLRSKPLKLCLFLYIIIRLLSHQGHMPAALICITWCYITGIVL